MCKIERRNVEILLIYREVERIRNGLNYGLLGFFNKVFFFFICIKRIDILLILEFFEF